MVEIIFSSQLEQIQAEFLWHLRKRFMMRYAYLEVLTKVIAGTTTGKAKEKQGSCPKERIL